MSSAPLISVIMPVHNAGAYLRPAVMSILGQTHRDVELVLVDDRCTDGAVEMLAMRDRRLRIVSNPGRGLVDALNAGVATANGEFLARMDADDIALPHRLATQLAYLQRTPEVGIAGAQIEIFSDAGVRGGFRAYEAWLNALRTPEAIARELYVESPIPHPTAVLRREVFQRLNGYRNTAWAEDYDLWLRADAAGIAMGKPDGVLLRWREHSGRLTREDARYSPASFVAAKAYYLARHRLRGRHVVIWGAGPTGRRLHDALIGHGVAVTAFIDVHPRRVGGCKRGLPVVPVADAARFRDELILGAVGARGARNEIRRCMRALAKVEGRDFLFAA